MAQRALGEMMSLVQTRGEDKLGGGQQKGGGGMQGQWRREGRRRGPSWRNHMTSTPAPSPVSPSLCREVRGREVQDWARDRRVQAPRPQAPPHGSPGGVERSIGRSHREH